jgi:hypothetical protein
MVNFEDFQSKFSLVFRSEPPENFRSKLARRSAHDHCGYQTCDVAALLVTFSGSLADPRRVISLSDTQARLFLLWV